MRGAGKNNVQQSRHQPELCGQGKKCREILEGQ